MKALFYLTLGRPTTLPERNSPVVPDPRPSPGQAAINIPLDVSKYLFGSDVFL